MRLPTVALVLAVAAAPGCSNLPSAWSTSADTGAPTFTLTPDLSSVTRTAVLDVTPSTSPLGQRISGTIFLEATAFWTPATPIGVTPERPELHVSIAPEGEAPGSNGSESTVLSEREETTLSVFENLLEGCTDADPCVQRFTVFTSRSVPTDETQDTVDVTWSLSADLFGTDGTAPPEGLTATLTLE